MICLKTLLSTLFRVATNDRSNWFVYKWSENSENACFNFYELTMTPSDILFCLINTQKWKYFQFTIMNDTEML